MSSFHLEFNRVVNGVANKIMIFNPQQNVVSLDMNPEDANLEIIIRDYPQGRLDLTFPSPQDREFWVNAFTAAIDNCSNTCGAILLPDTNIVTSLTTTTSTSTTTTTTAASTTTTTSSTTTTTTAALTTTTTSTTTLAPPVFTYAFTVPTGSTASLTIKKNSVIINTVYSTTSGSISGLTAGDFIQLTSSQPGGNLMSYTFSTTDTSATTSVSTNSTPNPSTLNLSTPTTSMQLGYSYHVAFVVS